MIKRSASITIQYDNIFSPFSGSEYHKGLEWIQTCRFDGAELIFSDPNLLDADKLLHKLISCNLKVATLATGQAMGIEGVSMTSPSEYKRLAARQRIIDDIDFSERLGNPNVTIGLLRGKGGELPQDKEYELLKRELSFAIEYATKKGVTLNLEPINRYECSLINSSESAYELIMELGNPANVGILYDTFHSNIEDEDMLATIKKIGHKISHVHFADSNRRLPGEGHTDFSQIIRTLSSVGYQGYVSLEVLNRPSAQHVIDHAGVCMQNIFAEAVL